MNVGLEDIPDLVGWVKWQVSRFVARGEATGDERDEMISQGVLILYELHERWDREKARKFSAYALSLFQNRMTDWYRSEVRSSGRGHVPQAKGGIRGPVVYHGMVSLDATASPQYGMSAQIDDAGLDGAQSRCGSHAFAQERSLTHYDAVDS